MALTTDLKSVLDGLFKSLGINLSGLDYQEQDKRRALENNLYNSLQNRKKSLTRSTINMADRGLTQSGIALQQASDVNLAADTADAGLQQGFDSDLASIARKKLAAETDYNTKKLDLEHQATSNTPIEAYTPAVSTPQTQVALQTLSNKAASMPQQQVQTTSKPATTKPSTTATKIISKRPLVKATIGKNNYS